MSTSVDDLHRPALQCNYRGPLGFACLGSEVTEVTNAVKTRVIRIGNSRGIRIPKVWLDQLKIGGEVELSVEKDGLTIRPAPRPREGWADAFRQMAAKGDGRLLDQRTTTKWQAEEWEW